MLYCEYHSERRTADVIISSIICVVYSIIKVVCPTPAVDNGISWREYVHSVAEIVISAVVERIAVEMVVTERIPVSRVDSVSVRIIVIAVVAVVIAYFRSLYRALRGVGT